MFVLQCFFVSFLTRKHAPNAAHCPEVLLQDDGELLVAQEELVEFLHVGAEKPGLGQSPGDKLQSVPD